MVACVFAQLRIGEEFGIYRNHRWYYDVVTDDLAAMNTAGYFNGLVARGGQVGDEVIATQWTTAIPVGGHPVTADAITGRFRFLVVQADLEADVVDVANGDAYTMTDSD